MTNLDYELRMSALNQLIHETLGVSLNTVRAAYGRARNTSIAIKSTASETGKLPLSSARPSTLADIIGDRGGSSIPTEARLYKPSVDAPVSHFPIVDAPSVVDGMRSTPVRSFMSRFRDAADAPSDEWQTDRSDALPMLVFSSAGRTSGVGETASDWHKLRNEFWLIAQADSTVMERYKRDVLG